MRPGASHAARWDRSSASVGPRGPTMRMAAVSQAVLSSLSFDVSNRRGKMPRKTERTPSGELKEVPIDSVIVDGKYQQRAESVPDEHIDCLVEAYGEDRDVPPPRVMRVAGIGDVLYDGFSRWSAHRKMGAKRVLVEMSEGSLRDLMTAVGSSNIGHGWPRSADDKRRSVDIIAEANPDWSTAKIAAQAGVSTEFARLRRKARESTSPRGDVEPAPVRIGTNGRKYDRETGAPVPAAMPSLPPPADNETPIVSPVRDRITEIKGFPTPRIDSIKRRGKPAVEKLFDLTGNPIPDHLGDVFADNRPRDILALVESAVETIIGAEDQLVAFSSQSVTGHTFAWFQWPEIASRISKMRTIGIEFMDLIREGLPFAACPKCEGNKNGCSACRFCGFWPRPAVEACPNEFRKIATNEGDPRPHRQ